MDGKNEEKRKEEKRKRKEERRAKKAEKAAAEAAEGSGEAGAKDVPRPNAPGFRKGKRRARDTVRR